MASLVQLENLKIHRGKGVATEARKTDVKQGAVKSSRKALADLSNIRNSKPSSLKDKSAILGKGVHAREKVDTIQGHKSSQKNLTDLSNIGTSHSSTENLILSGKWEVAGANLDVTRMLKSHKRKFAPLKMEDAAGFLTEEEFPEIQPCRCCPNCQAKPEELSFAAPLLFHNDSIFQSPLAMSVGYKTEGLEKRYQLDPDPEVAFNSTGYKRNNFAAFLKETDSDWASKFMKGDVEDLDPEEDWDFKLKREGVGDLKLIEEENV